MNFTNMFRNLFSENKNWKILSVRIFYAFSVFSFLLRYGQETFSMANVWKLVKVNDKGTRITSILTINFRSYMYRRCYGIFIVKFEQISHIILIFSNLLSCCHSHEKRKRNMEGGKGIHKCRRLRNYIIIKAYIETTRCTFGALCALFFEPWQRKLNPLGANLT